MMCKKSIGIFKFLIVLFVLSGAVYNVLALKTPDQLYVFPEEPRYEPFIEAIDKAHHKIYMAAYKFTNKDMCDALVRAAKRGVKVYLLKEPTVWMRAGAAANEQGAEDPSAYLNHPNIRIAATPASFNQTHSKMVFVDDKFALVTTANFTGADPLFRDFAVYIEDPKTLQGLEKVFIADMEGKRVVPDTIDTLVWGPDQQRSSMLRMINGAQKSITIYQQDMQDVGLVKALAAAARAGVDVRIIMTESPFGGEDKNIPNQTLMAEAGVKVMLCDPTYKYIHAKVMIADGEMYIGSCNFYTSSIDQTRELGVLSRNPSQVEVVLKVFEEDWQHSRPFIPPIEKK